MSNSNNTADTQLSISAFASSLVEQMHQHESADVQAPRAMPESSKSHKLEYMSPSADDLARVAEQLDKVLKSGHGEAIIELGLEEDGTPLRLNEDEFQRYLETLMSATRQINGKLTVINVKTTEDGYKTGHGLLRYVITGQVEKVLEVRVACCGNVDAGKSTLLGVLTSGDLDDGRGRARVHLFKHKHEIESGRTSSVGMEVMGFDETGQHICQSNAGRKLSWEDVSSHASKVITLLDLAGHEKYLKTTVFGMTGCSPDYVMLIVGSNAGVIGMTREHLGLALALNVPVLVVITKVDMCPPNVLESTTKQLLKMLKAPGCRKLPMFVKNMEDVILTAQNFVSERVCPIFQISSVAGTGLDMLKQFLNLLPTYHNYDISQPVDYQITETYSVPGVGTVVSGTVLTGVVHAGDTLLIGPDTLGHFSPCTVKSIQRKRVNVPTASAGQTATFALKKIKRAFIRKGMVMVSREADPYSCWEFEAEVLVLYHSSTIAERYQAIVHCGCIRQAARIVQIVEKSSENSTPNSSEQQLDQNPRPIVSKVIRTGDRALVRFRFIQYPEYIKPGTRLLFREGRTKGVGKVTRIYRVQGQ